MTSSSRAAPAVAGVVAAAVALATAELVAGILPGGRSPFVAVADRIIAATPGPVVRSAIDTFGSANRLVLLATMAGCLIAAGVLIGRLASRSPAAGPTGLLAVGSLGGLAMVADPLVPLLTAVGAPIAGALAGSEVLRRLLAVAGPRGGVGAPGPSAAATPGPGLRTRRAFLGLAGSAAGAAVAVAVTGRVLQTRSVGTVGSDSISLPVPSRPLPPVPAGASLEVPGISPVITPNADFYRIDTALTVPRIDPRTHEVTITGRVDRPFRLSYAELLDRADTEADVTLCCVSNEVGGRLVGNARWFGVPLADLLGRAGVQPGATQIVGRAVDGWTAGFPVEAAFDGRPALVAVGMNGEPLPARHGFPVRLVIAGLYGYVSDTKWLSEIELTTFEDLGAYWTHRGWSVEGPIKTQSRIDVPGDGSSVRAGTVAVAGVAWADEGGVSAVEVAIDDGDWQLARLAESLADSSWRQWLLRWDAAPGRHTLRVRATDAAGTPQTGQMRPPAPDGATGHHTITVTVT